MDQKSPPDLQDTQQAAPSHTSGQREESLNQVPSLPVISQNPVSHGHRVSIQEPVSILHSHRISNQEPSPSALGPRRVSIQEPLPSALSPRRVSIQEPPPSALSPRRVSIQEPPSSALSSRWVSAQESSEFGFISPQLSIQASLPSAYSDWASSKNAPSDFHGHHFNTQSPHNLTNAPSKTYSSQDIKGRQLHSLAKRLTRPSIDVPPSLTQSPKASIESIDWDDNESLRECICDSKASESSALTHASSSSIVINSMRLQNSRSLPSLLPKASQLLLEAKKVSHQLSLVLTLAGMMVITTVSFGQPWIHFWVPLRPPGDPAGSQTIPIDTILFVQCPDVSCLHEFDKNAYLLDLAWACFLISGITSFCVCAGLIGALCFPSSSLPLTDFFLLMGSFIAGTSIILGILLYLMQAKKYLQEGMTYTLGISFYLAWTGVFLFLMIGLFSYLNYVNFWSILALQAIWS
uniref:uncharacterized protein LOC123454633 n=1 Tax=Jaculus jaculus TaxID=51337 RepID=UPI001E1B2BFC|nr:uncharacterized protein LOC123454633 [Jaculus jaculus]